MNFISCSSRGCFKANLHDPIVVTTCSIQLILHRVRAKIAPISVKEVKEMKLSLHVGPTSCYYKSHRVNWPLSPIGIFLAIMKLFQTLLYLPASRKSLTFSD